jgi:hypothetical protein
MQYDAFADLSRPLTEQERDAVAEALDANVPGGGCVGLQNGPNDEIYFCVEASSEQDARTNAQSYVNSVLQTAGLDVGYELELQPRRRDKELGQTS